MLLKDFFHLSQLRQNITVGMELTLTVVILIIEDISYNVASSQSCGFLHFKVDFTNVENLYVIKEFR